jgi:uncharacterized membrane protein
MADLRRYCIILYGLYALSALLQFSESTLTISGLILILAYFMTTCRKKASQDTPFASHLHWLLRTFWIGTALLAPVSVIAGTFIVLHFTDAIPTMAAYMDSDSTVDTAGAIQNYMTEHGEKVSFVMIAAMIPATIWWLRRCLIGYVLAKDGRPVENVMSWL